MAQQFLKKKFSFRGLFLRFFAIVFFSLSVTVNVYAASPLTNLYENVINQPFSSTKTENKTKNTVTTPKTNIFTSISSFLDKYYDSYTSGLALVLYPTASPDIQTKTKLAAVTPSPSLRSGPTTPAVSPATTKTKIVYIPGPQGPAGPAGPRGPEGPAGPEGLRMISSSSTPVAYMPVGITIPNPSQNFTGGEYASIANLTSNLFTNNTSNINTLNVTTNSTIGGALSVTGATTLGGNLNVTGTITGSITGSMNPALTNGSVFFQDTAGISQDNANFFYDKTNHRLGLGTVTPATQLDVTGGIRALSRLSSQSVPATGTGVELGYYSDLDLGQLLSYDRTAGVPKPFQFSGSTFTVKTSTSTPVAALLVDSSGNTTMGLTTATSGLASNLLVAKAGTTNLAIRDTTDGVELMNYAYSGGGIIGTFTNHPLYIRANNSTAMSVLANGNVGIGTTSPTHILQLCSSGTSCGAGGTFDTVLNDLFMGGHVHSQFGVWLFESNVSSPSRQTGISASGYAGDLQLFAGGAEKMRVATTGNVGIGTTSPNGTLHVVSGAANNTAIFQGVGTTGMSLIHSYPSLGFNLYWNSGAKSIGAGYGGRIYIDPSTGNMTFNLSSAAAASADQAVTENTRVTILNNGNVGIGTTAPGAPLHVYTNTAGLSTYISAENGRSDQQAGLTLKNATAGSQWLTYVPGSSTDLRFFSVSPGLNNDVMTLKNTGNVGIGTTNPVAKLVVGSAAVSAQNTVRVYGDVAANSAPVLSLFRTGSRESVVAQTLNGLVLANTNGLANYNDATIDAAAQVLINTSGNVGIGTTNPAQKLQVSGITQADTAFYVGTGVGTEGGDDNLVKTTAASAFFNLKGGTGKAKISIGNDLIDLIGGPSDGIRFNYGASSSTNVGTTGMKFSQTGGLSLGNNTYVATDPGVGSMIIGGNLGIGTTAPGNKLSVLINDGATSSFTNATQVGLNLLNTSATTNNYNLISFEDLAGSGAVEIGAQFTDHTNHYGDFVVATRSAGGATEKFRVTSTGNVGIGTTAPTAALNLYSAAGGAFGLKIDGSSVLSNSISQIQLGPTYTTRLAQLNHYGPNHGTFPDAFELYNLTNSNPANGSIVLNAAGTGDVTVRTGGTTNTDTVERVRITSAGNVGIGTTAPAGKFEVSASAADASIYTTTYGAGQINGVVGRIARGTSASPAAAQQYDRLLSLSGTGYYTSGGTGFSNPLSGLAITQEAYETYTSTAQGNRLVFYTTANGSTTAISRLIIGQDGNIDVVTGNLGIGLPGAPAQKLHVNGTIRQTGGTNCALSANASGDIICTSDANLKQNISAFSNGLSVINAISPSYFQYKDESYTHIGFIAQNVQTVLPEATPLQNNGYLGLDTNAILAATVNAIKELDLKITDLTDLNDLTKANPLRDALVAWFGNMGNGVGDMFANVFNAKEKICVDGECLTKEDIRSLLLIAHPSGSSGSVVNNGGGNTQPDPAPTPEPAPAPENVPPAEPTPQ